MNNDKILTAGLRPLTDVEARRLLDDFFDGATSIADEKRLYAYFRSQADIPADMRRYGLMLGWLEEGMPEPAAAERKRRPRAQIWAFAVSVAAMVALVVTLGTGYVSHSNEQYALYEGSYVVHNGQKQTDLRSILPELRRAEARADASLASGGYLPEAAMATDAMDDDMRQTLNEILDI